MGRTLYLDSVAGVAGDMFAAAFVDAGLLTIEELNSLTQQLGLDGVVIKTEKVVRATVEATHLTVQIVGDGWRSKFPGAQGHGNHHYHDNSNLALGTAVDQHWHVHYPAIDKFLAESALEENVKRHAREIFAVIAEAEASVHGVEVEKAAFHEVGTVDSVTDVVMAAYCVEKVSAESVLATPIKPGRGMINIAHGTHPVPPPASAKLLLGMPIAHTPMAIEPQNIELTTPTGMAILRHLNPTFVAETPAGVLLATGRGAGTKDLGNYPNIFQVFLLETDSSTSELPYLRDAVVEIAFNVDDDTAEHMAWLSEKLLESGALDVWQTAGTGKKGRTMICFSVLIRESDLNSTADWILRNSTTFGLRHRRWDRLMLEREFETRTDDGHEVRYKIGKTTTGEKLKEKLEFDDWRSSRGQ
ncbi:MAG TPA: LarC family nickel insertion protein [Pyrinomonadaceae bacterium]|nr:LarC family nickel insertion protein [Pyrinomonadaceae bacterium]